MNIATLGYYVGFPFSNPFIRFYSIAILTGALLALLLSNYRAHKDGFDWHFFDTVFPFAFLAGIIGARIWYVIASWDEFAGRPFYTVFDMRSGGLAIQGGAIGGILVGVLYCIFRRKGTSILRIMDYAIPTIIIAQAIGRWGNFFNQEVFGHFIKAENWNFLPSFITNNMQNGSLPMGEYYFNGKLVTAAGNGIRVPDGSIAAPLFLVEGIVNIIFYFLIAYGVPAIFGKRYKNGDQSFAYFISYGIIRAILEPLRNPAFIMGDDGGNLSSYKSLSMAIAFIVLGIVLMVINHLLHHFANKGKFDKVPMFKAVFVEAVDQVVMEMPESNTRAADSQEKKEVSDSIDFSLLKAKEAELKKKDIDKEEHKDD